MRMQDLEAKIRKRQLRVGVIGLGYVGLPFAVEFAKAGVRTTGIDIDRERLDILRRGQSYIPDVPSQVVASLVEGGVLEVTDDYATLHELDAAFICVPTPFTRAKTPDLSFVIAAAKALGKYLHSGQIIVIQSTTYPGTTEEVVLPILEATGLRVGEDFFLAFSPERIDPGNRLYGPQNTPKVVGGIGPEASALVATLFELIVDRKQIHVVSSPKAAEMCKLLENTFRSVNIALVNELAKLCDRMGMDVWEVIDAAATKPFGFMPFYPGPGVGGHCIPVDPYYLSWKARESNFYTKFIELAAETNQSMPYYTVSKIIRALNAHGRPLQGSQILVLGTAFKRNVEDPRNSPSLEIMQLLHSYGARVFYNDPYIPKVEVESPREPNRPFVYESRALTPELLQAMDCVLIAVHHAFYEISWIVEHSRLIVDAQNATRGIRTEAGKVVRL
ncbi:MAG: nucleotide sugar dehydrogenase [Candidatus Methylomirabilales bacterium]